MTADLCSRSATDLADSIRRGDLSPIDVVEAHLERIDERNDTINAFLTVCDDRAREQARAAQRSIDDGDPLGPLHGVPVAIKDLYDVAGVRTTYGSRVFEDNVPSEDSIVAERLQAAGAIVIGKTNTPEFGRSGTTDNRLRGPTPTPFDLERTAGGSSGGSAAAVADGLVPLAHGTDAGGSVRIPASFCGVFGLKPSYGRVPIASRPDAFSHHSPTCCAGPITRTAEDAALMLSVLAGPHPRDPFSLPDDGTAYVDAVTDPVTEAIGDLRIGYSPDLGVFPVANEVRAVVDDAVDALEAATDVTTERVDVDYGRSHEEILETMYTGWSAVGHALHNIHVKREHGIDLYEDHRDALSQYSIDTIERGREYPAIDYKLVDVARTDVLDGLQDVFAEYDLLLSPTVGVPAFDKTTDGPRSIDGEPIPSGGWHLTLPFNFTGHPAASVPAGLTDGGLPVGLQIAGRRFRDDTVLAASAAFERIDDRRVRVPLPTI
ncbi:amidase [Natronosalvus caseinilyticus]|uniref:amidase n=1 Tax=Natronosalvus caseinilyticus TaxID=2953747 RepID=UPI0028ABCA01|nr:amidase [Natronosalvus caseinilyticus]